MSIWAEIKKSINSNLNKPLNITLDEIKENVIKKPGRVTTFVTGIPRNDNYSSQVLTIDDEALLSVNGSGRILKILPLYNGSGSATRNGTGLLTVDDNIILNNKVQYAYPTSDKSGYMMVNEEYFGNSMSITVEVFGDFRTFYFYASRLLRSDCSAYALNEYSIIAPNGIPFRNKFELRMTQTATDDTEKVGVIVVYELDE